MLDDSKSTLKTVSLHLHLVKRSTLFSDGHVDVSNENKSMSGNLEGVKTCLLHNSSVSADSLKYFLTGDSD